MRKRWKKRERRRKKNQEKEARTTARKGRRSAWQHVRVDEDRLFSFIKRKSTPPAKPGCCRLVRRSNALLRRPCLAQRRSQRVVASPVFSAIRVVVAGTWWVSGGTCRECARVWVAKPSGVCMGGRGRWCRRRGRQGTGVAGGPAGGLDRLNWHG